MKDLLTPQRLQKFLLWMSVSIIALTIAAPVYKEISRPGTKAVNGVLDLRGWKPTDSSTVKLDGEWEFYWNALLDPADFQQEHKELRPVSMIVPSSWDSIQMDGATLPDSGYATYRLRILLPEQHGVFGIKTSNIRASNRIFVNGEEVGHSGKPAESPQAIIHRNTPYMGFFEANGAEAEIIVQVASYKSFNSGIVQSISFGNQHAVAALNMYNVGLDGGLAGGFFTISVYFIGIFFQRRQHKELLFFGLCCVATLVFVLTHSERLIMEMFPDMSIEVQLYFEDIASIMMFSFFSRYVYHSFPGLYPKALLRAIEYIAILGVVLVLFTSASYNGPFVFGLSNLIVAVMLTNSFYMAKAARKGNDGSSYLYIGILGTLDFVIVNFLNNIWKLDGYYIFPAALPIIVLSQALYMSKQYTNSFRTIQVLSDKLSVVDKLKDEFLAKTSHELKTPLNGMINITQSLLNGAGGRLNASHVNDLKLVADTGRRLATLVHDILDYSKMKNHDLQLRLTHFDSYMVVNVVFEMFSHSLKNNAIRLINALPQKTFAVYADENRFMQIVYNLIDNAVKYTSSGHVEITAKQVDGFVYLTVADTGVGIPADKFDDIFTSFEQLELSLTRSHGGVGLGLAITKQLVELHNGTMGIESEVGVGSRFTFSVPAGKLTQMNTEDTESALDAALFGGLQEAAASVPVQLQEGSGIYRILAADDDYSSLKAMMNLLAVEQYAVTGVTSGQEALNEMMSGKNYDLIILDIMMPGMSGYDACRSVREKYSLLELPILLVTARTQYNDLAAGLAAGANDFLEKPYNHTELRSRVSTLVQLKRSAEELVRKELSFLQAQIKPHFIYNTLNTILSFSYTDHQRSRSLLSNFSIYLRSCFDYKETTGFVPLGKEIILLKAYLEIEKARFGDMLEVDIQADPAVLDTQIPSLIIQPLVENAIFHGIMKKENGGRLNIRVFQESTQLCIEVEDNGVGISEGEAEARDNPSPKRKGVALDNIRKRLFHLYGTDLTIRSEAGKGTTVTLFIP